MTTFDTTTARAVLDWIDAHPDLPRLSIVTHYPDSHYLQINGSPTIREVLAWHDEVTDARVELRHHPEDNSVHVSIRGSLAGIAAVLYSTFRGAECDLLLANGLVRDNAKSLVDVEVLRRLSDARGPEGGA